MKQTFLLQVPAKRPEIVDDVKLLRTKGQW